MKMQNIVATALLVLFAASILFGCLSSMNDDIGKVMSSFFTVTYNFIAGR